MYCITHLDIETGVESVMTECQTLEELAEVAKSLTPKMSDEPMPGQGTLFDEA